MSISLNKSLFNERIKNFTSQLNEDQSLVLVAGTQNEDLIYLKTISIQNYLLGYEFPETMMVIEKQKVTFMASTKKGSILASLKGGIEIEIKGKDSLDFAFLKSSIMVLKKDLSQLTGKMVTAFNEFTTGKDLQDAAELVSTAMSCKEDQEISIIQEACGVTGKIFKFYTEYIVGLIDNGKKITHQKISENLEEVILDDRKRARLRINENINWKLTEWCYPPIIQSGGEYDLKPSAQSNENRLHAGTILTSFGIRYKSYCSNLSRTILINPEKQQENDYSFLLELQTHVLNKFRSGIKCSEIYEAAVSYIAEHRSDLSSKFVKNLGFGIGIEFRDSSFLLSPKNSREIKKGMVFNFTIGFHDLEIENSKDPKGKNYALIIGDLVHVTDDAPEILTKVDSSLAIISYTFGDDEDDSTKVQTAQAKTRGAVIESQLRTRPGEDNAETEMKRKEHQKMLLESRQAEGLEKYAGHSEGLEKAKKVVFKKFESYRKDAILPKMTSTLQAFEDQSATFVRSLSYRSSDIGRMNEICKSVLELKKEMTKREQDRATRAGLVEQDDLDVVTGRRPPRLSDVFIRPQLEGKRFAGDVEIHNNGLRYQSSVRTDQKIDILFSNIKHFFFQPCEGELIILIHCHLHDAIMVGKKKSKDVQFYRDVTDASFDETGNRRRRANYGDEDELRAEQEERRHRQMLNREFLQFAERVADASKRQVEVDTPMRDLGFQGVPHRQLVSLYPTTEALVHLSETPQLVVTLADVEIAHLERVQFGLKNFDLVLVFKDFSRPVIHINTLPSNQLETVKDWLDSVDIPFTEGPVNLSWPQIMKTIQDDPKSFFEEAGGWTFLVTEGSVVSDEEESESEFEESLASSESEEESESEGASASDFGESESGSEGSGEYGSESGEDWDELEKKAAAHDKKKRDREEDEERHGSKIRRR